MNEYLESRIRRYIEGSISLRRFYNRYMMWHSSGWGNEEIDNPDNDWLDRNPYDDSRVTLAIYEFTSEPIASDPCREEWLKKELANILDHKGRWTYTEG